MKKILFTIVTLLLAIAINAQSVGNIKITDQKYGLRKMKKASKRIYINSFNVNYEVYKEAIDFKAGGDGGRISGNRSSATAKAAVGLSEVDARKMQEKTNELFNNYVNRLKSEGYEIVSASEAEKTGILKKWTKASGPNVKENLVGIISCTPEDYTFFYKDKGFLGLGGIGVQAKLSKALGDAIINDVNLFVMFSENGNTWMKGKAAKVKIKTNLRLVENYAISIPKKAKKKKSLAGKLFGSVRIKGDTDTYPARTTFTFSSGKTGLGSTGQFNGSLKEDLEINGVLKKEKITAYQKQGSFVPTSFSTFSDYLDAKADRFSTTTKWIDVDADKYAEGFYNACNTFLEKQLDAVFSKLK